MANIARKPDFVVVGSMKCGTTSLHRYLSCHPEVWMSRPKELRFFAGGDRSPGNEPPWGNWWRGEEWYRSHFKTDRRICGEASPRYVGAAHGALVAERMHRMLPQARLILLVREPMERLRSHYCMWRHAAIEEGVSFEDFVTDRRFENEVAYSDYGSQIRRLLEHFPRTSLLVVESADLDRHRDRTLAEIFAFLGVDPGFRSAAFSRRLFERKRRRFPDTTGERILRSPLMRISESILPFTIREVVRNLALGPFSMPEPDCTLPDRVEAGLRTRFRNEAELARQLTGLPLPSLGE